MRYLISLAAVIALAEPVSASSPAAWHKLQREAERHCIVESNFVRPNVSKMIVFDDKTAVVAFLVSGIHRAPHMKAAGSTNLCLYNRLTKRVSIQEAPNWRFGGR
jgi:hypothetical protein